MLSQSRWVRDHGRDSTSRGCTEEESPDSCRGPNEGRSHERVPSSQLLHDSRLRFP